MTDKELSKYVEGWLMGRYSNWSTIYHSINTDKRNGIYRITNGNLWVDTLDFIMGNIEDRLYCNSGEHLIPARFSSPHQFLTFLKLFGETANERKKLYDKLSPMEQVNMEILDIMQMLDDVEEMSKYCLESYSVQVVDDTYLKPYLNMREYLKEEDVDEFINCLDGTYRSIPYSVHKNEVKESYFHSVAYTVMHMLGFELITEKETSDGRIDMVLEMECLIYIFEFKYSSRERNISEEAIEQIQRMEYHKPYIHKGKRIIGVGVSFGKKAKTINGYKTVVLKS